jgi:hypothetical protein
MAAPGITGHTRQTKVKKQAGKDKRKRDDVDVEKLESAVQDLVGSIPDLMVIFLVIANPKALRRLSGATFLHEKSPSGFMCSNADLM